MITLMQHIELAGKVVHVNQLARDLGMDRAYLSRILSGKKDPRLSTARRVAAALCIRLDKLAEGIDSRSSVTTVLQNCA